MRKYWYYTCGTGNALWGEVCYSDCDEFDLRWRLEVLKRECRYATIISWAEISQSQYEKLKEYLENM